MHKLRTQQKGFTLVEGLLIVLIVALLAFAGYYVWHNQKKKKDDKAASTTSQTTNTSDNNDDNQAPAEVDQTVNWAVYTNNAGKFTLRTPTAWVQGANPQLCAEGTVLLGPTAAAAGRCATDGSAPQIVVSSRPGDVRNSYQLSAPYYTNIQKTPVTIAGVTGEKQTGVAQGQQDGDGIPGLPNGTQVTQYVFYTNGKTYTATYNQLPTYSDVLSDFNLMITKTLQFN